jgi:hypothetical protein
MSKIVFGDAIRAMQSRNDALIGAYRDAARSLPPGPVPNLASSMVEQRKDMAKTLASLAASPASRAEIDLSAEDDLAINPPDAPARAPGAAKDAAGLLGIMKEAEDSDYERLTGLAGSVIAVSAEAAELLASEANGAKKRAAWARDHLDLMGLAKP